MPWYFSLVGGTYAISIWGFFGMIWAIPGVAAHAIEMKATSAISARCMLLT